MGTAIASTRRLSMKQTGGRVANAVARLLNAKLSVPEIYLKPRLPGLAGVDVLAVDHAGSGDLHGSEILYGFDGLSSEHITALLSRLKGLPLHFKYLALPDPAPKLASLRNALAGVRAFDSQGLGRLGLISYPATLLEGEAPALGDDAAILLVKPERFLLRGERLDQMERFLEKARPDMRVRI